MEDYKLRDLRASHTLAQPTSGLFHFRRTAFSTQLKVTVGNILTKPEVSRINLNIDGMTIDSKSHTHPSHSPKLVYINLVSIL